MRHRSAAPSRVRLSRTLLVVVAFTATALALPASAAAHALIGRQDLPVPAWLFAWAASVVLIVSFVGLSVLWRSPRFEPEAWRPVGGLVSRLVTSRPTQVVAGAVGALLLGVTVWTGLAGTAEPGENFSVTFVYVTVWLGVVVASGLFGDVFRAVNPWGAIARAMAAIFRLVAGQSRPAPLYCPERLGRWPAAIGIFAFVWLELAYAVGFLSISLSPHTVAVAALVYSAYTFLAMTLFGIDRWLDRGEAFSVYHAMFARLSVFAVHEGRLGRRRVLSGTASWAELPGSIALVLITIGATTFDGAQEGLLASPLADTRIWLTDLGLSEVTGARVSSSLYMLLTLLVVAGIYWAGVAGMRQVDRSFRLGQLGSLFIHSFIPIALAYLVAHYFSFFVFLEQAQFTFLLSDPLGNGSDYFGTAGGSIDYGLFSANAIWYLQVGSLIVGHITALAIGHDRALKLYPDVATATRSQYWMLALMVSFTCLGLFLLSQANA